MSISKLAELELLQLIFNIANTNQSTNNKLITKGNSVRID
jgi:hypothetical protein